MYRSLSPSDYVYDVNVVQKTFLDLHFYTEQFDQVILYVCN